MAFSWQLRKLLCGLKTLLIFWDFAILNILCLKINITLIFMHSSSDEFMHITMKTQKQMFLLVSGGHICVPRRDTNMASPYKAVYIWAKCSSDCLVYELLHRPDSWQGFLYIYLLSLPGHWTFCFDWFAFLFLMAWQRKHRIQHKQYAPTPSVTFLFQE